MLQTDIYSMYIFFYSILEQTFSKKQMIKYLMVMSIKGKTSSLWTYGTLHKVNTELYNKEKKRNIIINI